MSAAPRCPSLPCARTILQSPGRVTFPFRPVWPWRRRRNSPALKWVRPSCWCWTRPGPRASARACWRGPTPSPCASDRICPPEARSRRTRPARKPVGTDIHVSIELSAAIRDRVRAYAGPFEAHPPAILSLFSGRTEAGTSDDGFFPFPADSDRGLGILLLTASLFRPGRPASGAGDPGSGHGGPSSGPDEVRPVAGAADAGHVHPGQEPEPVGRGVWDEGRTAGHGYGADEARVIAGLYHQYGTDIFRLYRLPFEALRGRTDALAAHSVVAERPRIPGILRSVCDFFYRVGPLVSWMAAADWEQRAGEIAQEIYWMGARSPTRTKARLFFWLACGIPGFGHRDDMRARA